MKRIIFMVMGILTVIACIDFFISAIVSIFNFSIGGILINGLLCYVFSLLAKEMFQGAK